MKKKVIIFFFSKNIIKILEITENKKVSLKRGNCGGGFQFNSIQENQILCKTLKKRKEI